MTTDHLLKDILRNLLSDTPDLEGAAVISTDGLVVASMLPSVSDEDRLSAMAAALLSLGERTVRELSCGDLEQVYVKGNSGYVVLMHAGHETVLDVIAGENARLGMVLLNMRHAVRELKQVLENPHPEQASGSVQRLDSSPRVRLSTSSSV